MMQSPGQHTASIVPPPFGSGYDIAEPLSTVTTRGFNCAAPFRERL